MLGEEGGEVYCVLGELLWTKQERLGKMKEYPPFSSLEFLWSFSLSFFSCSFVAVVVVGGGGFD